MKLITYSNACLHDLKKLKKSGKDISKFEAVVDTLAKSEKLAAKHKPHPLKGAWKPKWDCHIEPDWVLIYEVTKDRVILARTGSHSELFG